MRVHGIASVGGELFVIRMSTDPLHIDSGGAYELSAYDIDTFTLRRRMIVDGMTQPHILAACPYNKCLYIGENEHIMDAAAYICRMDLSTNQFTQWSVDGRPTGLSVTRGHNLLITLVLIRTIFEYTTGGCLLKKIELDAGIDFPLQAVELSSGQFVIRHRGNERHSVSIVDQAGRILQSYDGRRELSLVPYYASSHLAVDSQGNVFVADSEKNRVLLLTKTLTRIAYVSLPGDKLNRLGALHLHEHSRRLYICDDQGLHVFTAPSSRRQVASTF